LRGCLPFFRYRFRHSDDGSWLRQANPCFGHFSKLQYESSLDISLLEQSRFRGRTMVTSGRTTPDSFDLDIQYGLGEIRHNEFWLTVFSSGCIVGHLVAVGFLAFEFLRQDGSRFSSMAVVLACVFVLLLFANRPAMCIALRMIVDCEAAIGASRCRQHRGWAGLFLDLFPFAFLVPPGDLLAIGLVVLRIRANTDHLNQRQSSVFLLAEIWALLGGALQYAGFGLLIASISLSSGPPEVAVLALVCVGNILLAVGVGGVAWSLRTIRKELNGVIRLTHWDQDPVHAQLAALQQAPLAPEIVAASPVASVSKEV
jgi:hypothetical protein